MDKFVLFRGNRWDNDITSIKEKFFDQWEDLVRVDFSLHNGEKGAPDFEINNDEKLAIFFAANYSSILVQSHAVGFRKLKGETVFQWAEIGEIVVDDSRFGSIDIDLDNTLHAHVIQHALQDLMYKNELYGPITDCFEASVREYISAVLLACAKIAGNVKLIAELNIVGKKANGPLDYAMLYKKFFLLITEAKKDNINHGVIQNLGQLLASREESLYNLAGAKKRNYMSMASDIASIPSTGIASTGKEWILIRYVLLPKPAVFKSSPISLPFVDGSSEDIKRHLLTLVSKLLGAIDLQKRAVDQYGSAKAQKLDEEEV
eukprot:CAMPEP_0201093118 /NCGR_PEP_ID=MMETSP0812-20130820/1683_1 /ASSEMBLY_ACC=CAM_ASM_000668 /TAXON_ID=98059 /ORGANISM="Dinobryon sp., Strain UTEXLB2267" /LENGTH=317 /DNA_ID=CAMNT_0047345133 /DNA_START=283 /DNA_END=1237 /DNA_ORIENTATION=+